MRAILLVFAVSLFIIVGCGGHTGTNGPTNTDTVNVQSTAATLPVQSKLGDSTTRLLVSVVEKYYDLKNAFVATRSDKVQSAANELGATVTSFKAILGNDPANSLTLKPYIDTILAQCDATLGIKDESCEKQRLAFGPLSSAMYGLVKAAGLKNAHIYQEYCPMAFNDKGAHWLSNDSEIKNPYFGKKMLECGEVTDVIR